MLSWTHDTIATPDSDTVVTLCIHGVPQDINRFRGVSCRDQDPPSQTKAGRIETAATSQHASSEFLGLEYVHRLQSDSATATTTGVGPSTEVHGVMPVRDGTHVAGDVLEGAIPGMASDLKARSRPDPSSTPQGATVPVPPFFSMVARPHVPGFVLRSVFGDSPKVFSRYSGHFSLQGGTWRARIRC